MDIESCPKKTGAEIVFEQRLAHPSAQSGQRWRCSEGWNCHPFDSRDTGHTPESICVLAKDSADDTPAKLFSGDTLFIGDVGRPDLVGSKGYSDKEMAGLMYETLHEKILSLSDDVELFPAHGAGSLCGKHLSNERSSTIGQQRQFNYALKPMTKETFVEMLTTDQPEVPAYFPKDVEINRMGASPLNSLTRPHPLVATEVAKEMQRGGVVLDVRSATEHASGCIMGSLNIGLGGQFASWAGTLIEIGTPIIILANDLVQVDEAVMRLARVGFESVIGYLENGISSWNDAGFEVAQLNVISVDELKRVLEAGEDLLVVDVRRTGEYDAGHVPNAISIPLAELAESIPKLPVDRTMAIICASGYRSSIAIGVLERGGVNCR
ncbi:MAG: MBL fold metallo-hydrolase [Candidatus Obscuribacter sp.]|nr:MBL fold metallo-hydrolase [Candidatus Obscuribacter sp.]